MLAILVHQSDTRLGHGAVIRQSGLRIRHSAFECAVLDVTKAHCRLTVGDRAEAPTVATAIRERFTKASGRLKCALDENAFVGFLHRCQGKDGVGRFARLACGPAGCPAVFQLYQRGIQWDHPVASRHDIKPEQEGLFERFDRIASWLAP
jgi:hypothetical protein